MDEQTISTTLRQALHSALYSSLDRDWKKADLCSRCASVDLGQVATRRLVLSLQIPSLSWAAQCPMCYFIYSCLDYDLSSSSLNQTIAPIGWVLFFHQHVNIESSLGTIKMVHTKTALHEFPPRSRKRPVTDISTTVDTSWKVDPFLPIRQLQTQSVDFTLLKTWITECEAAHGYCCRPATSLHRQGRPNISKLTVIDCAQAEIVILPQENDFVALSYVWGSGAGTSPSILHAQSDHHSESLVTDTQGAFHLPHRIPKTIADSMELVLRLGMRYLWVDKYCIDQSSPESLHAQLSAMDTIYESARLTIIAATGDATSGLHGITTTPRNAQPQLKLDGRTWLSALHGWDLVERSSWSSRAWTYQEGLCSVRRLVFTTEQVLFECNAADSHEAVDDTFCGTLKLASNAWQRPPRAGHFQGGLQDLYCSLATHIIEYTKRELSYQSDALNAIRGIFQRYAHATCPIQQYWGIPITLAAYIVNGYKREAVLDPVFPATMRPQDRLHVSFAYGLLWILKANCVAVRRPEFPSWSWAGWMVPVRWPTYSADMYRNISANFLGLKDIHIVITVQEGNGKEELLNDELIRLANHHAYPASENPPILKINAEVMSLRFSLSRKSVHSFAGPFFFIGRQIQYEPYDPYAIPRFKFSHLSLTTQVEEGDELWQALCNESLSCIVLHPCYALVVWSRNQVKIKIGVLKLLEDATDAFNVNEVYENYALEDKYARQRRTICVG